MELLLSIAISLLAGLLMSRVVKPLKLPAVTGYLVAGLLIGPFVLGAIGINGLGFTSLAQVDRLKPISEVVREVYDNLNLLAQEGERLPGVPTGLIDLDNRILGLNKGELVLIASRPGMGKTSIAMNIVVNVAKATGRTVAVFSLEMAGASA